MAKRKKRSATRRTRTIFKTKWRNRPGSARRGRRGGRRRSGSSFGSPFRQSGSFSSRLTGSALPVAKMLLPILVGAVGGAMLAKYVAPKMKGSPAKTGALVAGAAILLGAFAGKFGRGLARPVQLAALGIAADGAMRMLRGKLPGLPAGDKGQGLLADARAGSQVVDLSGQQDNRARIYQLAG